MLLLSKTTLLGNIDAVLGVISSLFVIFGTILAFIQYFHQKKLARIREASNIAKYFEEDMVDMISLIMIYVSLDQEIDRIIKEKRERIEKAKYFNAEELDEIFSKDEIKKYREFISDKNKVNGKVTIKDLLSMTMNKMEHCAISFNSNLAEDKTVYQSLHQLVFKIMPIAYVYIASLNTNNVDKYYTNACLLYRNWLNIRNNALKKEKRAEVRYQKQKDARAKAGTIKTPAM